jgi:hypothetical protein
MSPWSPWHRVQDLGLKPSNLAKMAKMAKVVGAGEAIFQYRGGIKGDVSCRIPNELSILGFPDRSTCYRRAWHDDD